MSATFEWMIDAIFRGLKWPICLFYFDDVVICSSKFTAPQILVLFSHDSFAP